MSVKGLPDLKGNVKDLLGEGAGALPTVRDVLQSFMNTRDPIWRCPNQPPVRLAPGQSTTFRHRIVILSGTATPDQIETYYRDFTR